MKPGLSLKRDSTNMTIAEFYERYQLDKYNFDPDYQRRGDVWTNDKKSFLIDSILKNFPMPPVFLHQRIDDETGTTKYDIIDGKQRLTAIISFIQNEISLPQTYEEGSYGDFSLNDLKFEDLNGGLASYRKQFWRYSLSVEYIDPENGDVVKEIFDRLNRNGEPLEPQELRNARYHNTDFLKQVSILTKSVDWGNLQKVKISRMQDEEFVSELMFYLLEGEPTDASTKAALDERFETWTREFNLRESVYDEAVERFKACLQFLKSLDLDYSKYKIKGVSHFYALFALADACLKKKIDIEVIKSKIDAFYSEVRTPESTDLLIQDYRSSMISNTRSKNQRNKRINALLSYCFDSQS